MTKLNFPLEFKGNPIILRGATGNPYEGLDEVSGCNATDPDIRRIAEKTRKMQEVILASTIVAPGDVLKTLSVAKTMSSALKAAQKEIKIRTNTKILLQ